MGIWRYLVSGEATRGPITVHGNVEIREADLAFPVSGRLAAYHVREGEPPVAVGELIATLEGERYRQAVAGAGALFRRRLG